MSARARYPKRLLDCFVAAIGIVVLLPLFVATAAAVAFKLGRPIFFAQLRPGVHGRPFKLIKFRTMRESRDAHGDLLGDGERLTPFGAKLRSTSLDELPELWNVLKGDMSLVGPRPLLMQYIPLYTDFQRRRHEVRPGITGWAQVNGRNSTSWPQRFQLDVWYVDNVSLWLDIKILAMTVARVFLRRGITAEGSATMPEFDGSADNDDTRS